MLEEILEYNKKFVYNKEYNKYKTSKYPEKKLAIVSCMDTRLIELLPEAVGVKNGDAKLIKNAGGVITHPFGSVMRSLIIGIYELGIEEILVIGHTDCGARFTDSTNIIEKMKKQGIPEKNIEMIKYCGINFDDWVGGFNELDKSIISSVDLVKNHPLIPKSIKVYGLIIDSETGELYRIV